MIEMARTMRDQFNGIADTQSFGYALRDFLDRLRDAPSFGLLAGESAHLGHVLNDDGRADAYLASAAAYLAHEHQLPVPDWAAGTSRALQRPWFAAKTPNLKAILLQESPAAFRIRNLFVSANALSRA